MSKQISGPIERVGAKSKANAFLAAPLNGSNSDRDGGRRLAKELSVASSHALAVIKTLTSCLDEETAALKRGYGSDLVFYSNRKGQGMMELMRALSSVGGLRQSEEIAVELKSLRARIHENMNALRLHVAAVEEISIVLSEAIQSSESDGTYSASIHARRSGS